MVHCGSDLDDEAIKTVIEPGREIYREFQELPEFICTPAERLKTELEEEMRALEMEEDACWVIGNAIATSVIAFKASEIVQFHGQLMNCVVNLMPVPDLGLVTWTCYDTTQMIGIYSKTEISDAGYLCAERDSMDGSALALLSRNNCTQ